MAPKQIKKRIWVFSILIHGGLVLLLLLAMNEWALKTAVFKRLEAGIQVNLSTRSTQKTAPAPVLAAGPSAVIHEIAQPGDHTTGVTESAATAYLSVLRQRISEHQSYPRVAEREHLEATIELEVEMSDHGEVLKIEPIQAQKPQILITAAIDAVHRASPLPPPPDDFPRKFVVPIVFLLSKP